MALQSDPNTIAVVGINDENVQRMRAGLPLDIDLTDITPPGKRITRVVVHIAHDYEHVLDDMEEAGLPISEVLRKNARDMDARLLRERREKAQHARG